MEDCKEEGFNLDVVLDEHSYQACNNEGYQLELYYYTNDKEMRISVDAPMEMMKIQWSTSAIAQILPVPEFEEGYVKEDDDKMYEVYLRSISKEAMESYIEECGLKGFKYNIEKNENYYYAQNEEGYQFTIEYVGLDTVLVSIIEPQYNVNLKLKCISVDSMAKYDVCVYVDDSYEDTIEEYDAEKLHELKLGLGEHTLEVVNDDDYDMSEIITFNVEDAGNFTYEIHCSKSSIQVGNAGTVISTENEDKYEKVEDEPIAVKSLIPELSYKSKRHFTKFQETYETGLENVLDGYGFELLAVEYTELVPDNEKDYYEIDRINEYEVLLHVQGDAVAYEEMYELIIDIRCNNNYLLSNNYEILSSGAYVDEDCKEKGFHQVSTVICFEDGTEYKVDFRSVLKNGEKVWSEEKVPVTEESMVKRADAAGDDCHYEDCNRSRAAGRLYCHIHKCNEEGCTHSTSPIQSYCSDHIKD